MDLDEFFIFYKLEPTGHVDENSDHRCDVCGARVGTVIDEIIDFICGIIDWFRSLFS